LKIFNIELLKQSEPEAQEITESSQLLSYITNVDMGNGLMKICISLVPFADKFPHNTKL